MQKLKQKSKSSISVGFHYLSIGKIDGFAALGNTGAVMLEVFFLLSNKWSF